MLKTVLLEPTTIINEMYVIRRGPSFSLARDTWEIGENETRWTENEERTAIKLTTSRSSSRGPFERHARGRTTFTK